MGLISAGIEAAANVGAKGLYEAYTSRIALDREEALAEFRESLIEKQKAADVVRAESVADKERKRVAEFAKPVATPQGDGMLAPATSDAAELTKTGRQPTINEMRDRAVAAGDVKIAAEIGKLDDKDVANALKAQIAQGRLDNAIQIANIKGDFGLLLGQLRGEIAKGKSDGNDKVIIHQFMSSMDRDISHNQDSIRQLRRELANPIGIEDSEKEDIKSRIAELEVTNARITSAKREFAKEQGIKIPESLTAPPPKDSGSRKPIDIESVFPKKK